MQRAVVVQRDGVNDLSPGDSHVVDVSTSRADCHVLVVDDDAVMRRLVVTLLRALGMAHVSACRCGTEAVAACTSGGVDVALVDRHLAGEDGVDLIERIGRMAPEGGPVMLMLTGDDHPQVARRALAAGAWDVLVKPFDPEVLVRRIDCLLRLQRRRECVGEPPQP